MSTSHRHDGHRAVTATYAQRREQKDTRNARLQHDLSAHQPTLGPWQAGFLLRFALHVAFYGWVGWWLLGMPPIPIKWLQ